MENEKKALTGKEVEVLDADELAEVSGGKLVIRKYGENSKMCYVITCPKCGSDHIMMKNHYKTSGGVNRWYIGLSKEEVDGALDMHKNFVNALVDIDFRCVDCGYAAKGFEHMNYTTDLWANYQ